jgi:hypothetical protein
VGLAARLVMGLTIRSAAECTARVMVGVWLSMATPSEGESTFSATTSVGTHLGGRRSQHVEDDLDLMHVRLAREEGAARE